MSKRGQKQILNHDVMVEQANVDKKRIVAKGQAERNKVIQSLTAGGPIVGQGSKYQNALGKKKNARDDMAVETKKRQHIIKENKMDNQSAPNAWRLAIAKVREANPELSYKECLKMASAQYKRNVERRDDAVIDYEEPEYQQ